MFPRDENEESPLSDPDAPRLPTPFNAIGSPFVLPTNLSFQTPNQQRLGNAAAMGYSELDYRELHQFQSQRDARDQHHQFRMAALSAFNTAFNNLLIATTPTTSNMPPRQYSQEPYEKGASRQRRRRRPNNDEHSNSDEREPFSMEDINARSPERQQQQQQKQHENTTPAASSSNRQHTSTNRQPAAKNSPAQSTMSEQQNVAPVEEVGTEQFIDRLAAVAEEEEDDDDDDRKMPATYSSPPSSGDSSSGCVSLVRESTDSQIGSEYVSTPFGYVPKETLARSPFPPPGIGTQPKKGPPLGLGTQQHQGPLSFGSDVGMTTESGSRATAAKNNERVASTSGASFMDNANPAAQQSSNTKETENANPAAQQSNTQETATSPIVPPFEQAAPSEQPVPANGRSATQMAAPDNAQSQLLLQQPLAATGSQPPLIFGNPRQQFPATNGGVQPAGIGVGGSASQQPPGLILPEGYRTLGYARVGLMPKPEGLADSEFPPSCFVAELFRGTISLKKNSSTSLNGAALTYRCMCLGRLRFCGVTVRLVVPVNENGIRNENYYFVEIKMGKCLIQHEVKEDYRIK